ncbi:MAG: SMC family ATPase [archaeon]
MRFKKIKLSNIRSYQDQEINFPEGSLLLSGDVGCGKTTILMALEYALFGLQPGQKGNALLRNNENIGEVSLALDVQGKEVLIERKLKRTPRGVSNEYAAITIDGIKNESSVTEIKSQIVSLLGYPPEFIKKNNILYRYTVHTAQEQMKQIILEDSETRVNILRHVFGIDKYRIIKNNLSTLLASLKGNSKILQGEISELDRDRETLAARKSGITTLEGKISSKKIELEEKTRAKNRIESELKTIEKNLQEKRVFEQEIEKTKILISTKRELLLNLTKGEEELRRLIIGAGEVFSELTYNDLISQINTKRAEFEQLNSKNSDILAKCSMLEQEKTEILSKKERIFKIDICPTCLQDVSEHHKHNIMNETESKLSRIKSSLEALEIERQQFLGIVPSRREQIMELEDARAKMEIRRVKQEQIERAKKKVIDISIQKESLTRDQDLLLRHIDDLKGKILKYSPLELQEKNKDGELRQAVLEERNVEISLAELIRELELSHKEILLFQEMIKRKEDSKKRLYKTNELIDWFSNQFLKLIDLTERNVLLKLRKEFSTLFRKWFLMLVSESSLDSQIDENFTPIILQGETEMDYSYLSGGERTAVALAYRLALNQTINSLMSKIKTRGIIILDEPTDGFSEAQINKVRDILEELNAEQLIIVSHEQKIESFVENVIKINKESDVSSIEEILNQKSDV